jgi:hypothetical protein
MSRARLRLVLTAALFCAWIGWLAFLALTTTRPVVLSRPQFLASQLDVVATLTASEGRPDPNVKVQKIGWPVDEATQKLAGQTIKVVNLPELTNEHGWEGPDSYILPLVKEGDEYRVAPIAVSPGLSERKARPRIYRATPETLEQLKEIRRAG